MKETINGHTIETHDGHYGKLLIYIDSTLASNGIDRRPHLRLAYWKQLLRDSPQFDALCLLPDHLRPEKNKPFEELYVEAKHE